MIIDKLRNEEETAYYNRQVLQCEPMSEINGKKFVYIRAAQERLMRFMPFIRNEFKDTEKRLGIIESDVLDISDMMELYRKNGVDFRGRLLLKDDARLPVSGSVKARGGIYEVLKYAEDLAVKELGLVPSSDHAIFSSEEYKKFFSQYTIHVASTGNLGLSVGIIGAALGFKVVVHMSKDARGWKKNKLRSLGVTVIEYENDYSAAVERGREISKNDSMSYFVDDEDSLNLFMGYATAALRLKVQLMNGKIPVSKEHPLFVYIPCGVGGAPGGISYGLKQMYGDCVHCFFIEPVKAPAFTYSLALGGENRHVDTLGLIPSDTVADGLAVGRASKLVLDMTGNLVSGSMTIRDDKLLKYQKDFYNTENIYIEPSAAAGFIGPEMLYGTEEGRQYLKDMGLWKYSDNSTHIIWATGGGMVPECEREI